MHIDDMNNYIMETSMPVLLQGWLVDLVNLFGKLGGFDILLERFTNGPNLTVPVIAALIK